MEMTTSVHLRRTLGEPGNPPTNRCTPILETRNHHQKIVPEVERIFPSQTKIHDLAEIRTKAIVANTDLNNLEKRLQILRSHLGSLKTRLATIFDELYKVPPDPGPRNSPSTQSFAVTKETPEKTEEFVSYMLEEVKENSPSIESFKWGKISPQIPPVTPSQAKNHYILQPRCLWNCAREEAKGRSFVLKPSAKGVSISREGDSASILSNKAGKEEEEFSNVAVKHVMFIHLADVCQLTRNWFLDVVFFVSVMFVNLRQLINNLVGVFFIYVLSVNPIQLIHNRKKVWEFRGGTDESPLEAEVSRKSTWEFLDEGDWKHVNMGEPWKFKGNAFLVEGIIAGIGPSVAPFTHVPTKMQYWNINGLLKGMCMFVCYVCYTQYKIHMCFVSKRLDYCETEISEEVCHALSGRNDNPRLGMYGNAKDDWVGYEHMQELYDEKEICGQAEERFDCQVTGDQTGGVQLLSHIHEYWAYNLLSVSFADMNNSREEIRRQCELRLAKHCKVSASRQTNLTGAHGESRQEK